MERERHMPRSRAQIRFRFDNEGSSTSQVAVDRSTDRPVEMAAGRRSGQCWPSARPRSFPTAPYGDADSTALPTVARAWVGRAWPRCYGPQLGCLRTPPCRPGTASLTHGRERDRAGARRCATRRGSRVLDMSQAVGTAPLLRCSPGPDPPPADGPRCCSGGSARRRSIRQARLTCVRDPSRSQASRLAPRRQGGSCRYARPQTRP